jgi:hypothetical protein
MTCRQGDTEGDNREAGPMMKQQENQYCQQLDGVVNYLKVSRRGMVTRIGA